MTPTAILECLRVDSPDLVCWGCEEPNLYTLSQVWEHEISPCPTHHHPMCVNVLVHLPWESREIPGVGLSPACE